MSDEVKNPDEDKPLQFESLNVWYNKYSKGFTIKVAMGSETFKVETILPPDFTQKLVALISGELDKIQSTLSNDMRAAVTATLEVKHGEAKK